MSEEEEHADGSAEQSEVQGLRFLHRVALRGLLRPFLQQLHRTLQPEQARTHPPKLVATAAVLLSLMMMMTMMMISWLRRSGIAPPLLYDDAGGGRRK